MTQMLDRPNAKVDTRSATETLPRPMEVEREEIRQPPPPEAPPRMFRWLGWLLGIALVAAVSWLVVAEMTSDEPVTATPSYVVRQPGTVTADPKLLTPVVTPPLLGEATRPGDFTLTDLVNAGTPPPAATIPEATTWPWVYWMPPYQEVTFMAEATVSPAIYWSQAPAQPFWTVDGYLPSSLDILPVDVPSQSPAAPASHGGHLHVVR